jgi:hypothetical protein
VPVDFEVCNISGKDLDQTELNNALISIERNGVALMGACCYEYKHNSKQSQATSKHVTTYPVYNRVM